MLPVVRHRQCLCSPQARGCRHVRFQIANPLVNAKYTHPCNLRLRCAGNEILIRRRLKVDVADDVQFFIIYEIIRYYTYMK